MYKTILVTRGLDKKNAQLQILDWKFLHYNYKLRTAYTFSYKMLKFYNLNLNFSLIRSFFNLIDNIVEIS